MGDGAGIAGNTGVVACGLGARTPFIPPQHSQTDGKPGKDRSGKKAKDSDHRQCPHGVRIPAWLGCGPVWRVTRQVQARIGKLRA